MSIQTQKIRDRIGNEIRDAGEIAANLIENGFPDDYESKSKRARRRAEALGLAALTAIVAYAGPKGYLQDGPAPADTHQEQGVTQVDYGYTDDGYQPR